MVLPVHDRRVLWPLLSALVILAMWSSAVARVSCSHLSDGAHRCLAQDLTSHSHKSVESQTSEEEHCTSMQMSGGHMHDLASPDTELADGATSVSRKYDLLESEIISQAAIDPVSAEAITQSTQQCSCIMHSPSDASSASQAVLLSGSYLPIVAADARVPLLLSLPSLIGPVDLHDHGPPGAVRSRHVLNSTFRI
jgi:hypothetical protein